MDFHNIVAMMLSTEFDVVVVGQGSLVRSFGTADFEEMVRASNLHVSVPSWCSVDIILGVGLSFSIDVQLTQLLLAGPSSYFEGTECFCS